MEEAKRITGAYDHLYHIEGIDPISENMFSYENRFRKY